MLPKNLHSVEEDIASNIGAVMTEGVHPESGSNLVDQIYEIGAMTSPTIGSVKVSSIPPRNIFETKATV